MHADCLFCKIATGEVKAYEVHRDERIVAFLDIGPIRPGHLQIIPRAHFETFDDLPADLAGAILQLGQRFARKLKEIYAVDRVAFMFTGGDIPHAHAHVIPLVEKTDVTSRRYIAEPELTFRELPFPGDESMRKLAAELAGKSAD